MTRSTYIVSIAALFSLNAFAGEITGEAAGNIYSMLETAGAQKAPSARIVVTDLRCDNGYFMDTAFQECSFASANGETLGVSHNDADRLFQALSDAGLPITESAADESIQAARMSCSSTDCEVL